MKPKYIGKIVALPKDVTQTLEDVRAEIAKNWGFTPSLSETVAFLAAFWKDKKGAK